MSKTVALVIVPLLLIFAMGGMIGADWYSSNEPLESNIEIFDNISINAINDVEEDFNSSISSDNINYVVGESVSYLIKMSFRIARIGMQIGYDNPEYDFNYYARLIIIVFTVCMILPVLPFVLAIIYLIYKLLQKVFMWLNTFVRLKI